MNKTIVPNGVELIRSLHLKNRAHTTDEFEESIHMIVDYLEMHQSSEGEVRIHEYPTGKEYNFWKVPPKWVLRKGELRNIKGEVLISLSDHPLVVIPFSDGFEGRVSRAELFKHLHYREDLPNAIPYVFRKQYRHWEQGWGLAVPFELAKTLQDEEYEVVIDAEFEPTLMKVLEYTWRGESDQMITLCAHLDHTGQCNDGLSGVVGIIEALIEFQKRIRKPYFTYRLIICPEISGSAIYLNENKEEAKKIVACLCPNMLGHEAELAFCTSRQGTSRLDKALFQSLVSSGQNFCVGEYRQYPDCGDEISFDAPGFEIPTSTLSRVGEKFSYYHTSFDSFDALDPVRFNAATLVMATALELLEMDYIPKRTFIGNPCMANQHFNLYLEPKNVSNLFNEASKVTGLYDIRDSRKRPDPRIFMDYFLASLDGSKSLLDIADGFSVPFPFVYAYAQRYLEYGLIKKLPL